MQKEGQNPIPEAVREEHKDGGGHGERGGPREENFRDHLPRRESHEIPEQQRKDQRRRVESGGHNRG